MNFLALAFALFFALPSFAQSEKITFGGQYVPGLLESENSGQFVHLVHRICEQLQAKPDIRIYPVLRAVKSFEDGKFLVLFPSSKVKLGHLNYIASDPFYTKRIYIFTKGKPVLSDLKDLAGKRVGVTLGYNYPQAIYKLKNIEIQTADSDDSNLMKLSRNRIEVVLGEEQSLLTAAIKSGIKIQYDQNHPVETYPIFFAFQKNAEGQRWAQRFNEALHTLKENGELDKILAASVPDH